ncbi:MAG: c-type cytochrome [Pseudomonadota bacterium]
MNDNPVRRIRLGILGFALSLTLAALPAGAADGAAEYRNHVMAAIGGHMQASADILQQKVAHQGHLQMHAAALAELADVAPLLFPEGSGGGDALPAIWENPDDFESRLASFQEAAQAFESAVSTGNGIGPAINELGQSCKSCHDDYRAE